MSKFNFIKEAHLPELRPKSDAHFITVNLTHGTFIFSIGYVRDKSLEGRGVELFADVENKMIGWKFKDIKTFDDLKSSRRIQVVKNNRGSLSARPLIINKMLKQMRLSAKTRSGRYPIQTQQISAFDGIISYIKFENE